MVTLMAEMSAPPRSTWVKLLLARLDGCNIMLPDVDVDDDTPAAVTFVATVRLSGGWSWAEVLRAFYLPYHLTDMSN
jgi:hypothetical protein